MSRVSTRQNGCRKSHTSGRGYARLPKVHLAGGLPFPVVDQGEKPLSNARTRGLCKSCERKLREEFGQTLADEVWGDEVKKRMLEKLVK